MTQALTSSTATDTRASHTRAIAVLVPLLALLAGTYWVTHPTSFRWTDGPAGTYGAIEVGEPIHVGMTFETDGRDADVALRRAKARVVEDSAESTIEFQVCTYAPTSDSALASVRGDLSRYCSGLEPVEGTTYRMRASGRVQEILMTITPHRPGRIEVNGVTLTYRDGWRFGTQSVGQHVDFTAT